MFIYFQVDPLETPVEVVVKTYPGLTSAIGSPFTGGTLTSLDEGQWKVNVGSITGYWKLWINNADDELISFGFATSTLVDVNGDAHASDYPTWLSPSPPTIVPSVVTATGQLDDAIVISADYLAVNDRALEWTVAAPTGATLADSSCQLGFFHPTKGTMAIQGTITDATGGYWLLSFDIRAIDTAHLLPGEYEWTVQVTTQDGQRIPVVRNADRRCQTVTLVANRAPLAGSMVGYVWDGGSIFRLDRIQFRRDTEANWLVTTNILAIGEPGYFTDTGEFVIGDGVSLASAITRFVPGAGGGGGGDVATDAIWNVAGDTVHATGNNTAVRLGIGAANSIYSVNSGATAPEWKASSLVTVGNATNAANATTHIANNIDAHAGSAITVSAFGTFASGDVQDTLQHLDTRITDHSAASDPHPGYLTAAEGSASFAAVSHTHSASDIASGTIGHARLGSGGGGSTKFLREDSTYQTIPGGGDALTANPLSQFASTTSAQLAGVISDETGSGLLVFATSPTLTTPVLGVATATSINKVAFTAPSTSATLTIADGSTLTVSTSATITNGTHSGTNTGDQTNISGNAATATLATTATNITAANEASDTTCFLVFVTAATGDLGAKTNANLAFNSSTGALSLKSVNVPSIVNTITANAMTVDLAASNHQICDLDAATGAVTITLTVPANASAGTLVIIQDSTARDITWAVSGGTVRWSSEPNWATDAATSHRVVSWLRQGTIMYLCSPAVFA